MAISLCIKGREEMTENIIIKPSVQKRFDSFMAHGRVLFFSAPCGFGKTVLADALLRGRNVLRQSAADPDCAIPPSAQDWDILLIDDLQLMQEEAGQQALCELIRSSPERHFVLLSRGVPSEIGAILNIKLSTVKIHVWHILTKLNVSRRSEAKTTVKKLRLIPDDL